MKILHTMLRVSDLVRSIDFYTTILGMQLVKQIDNPEYKYTLAFVGYNEDPEATTIELTYNWGKTSYVHGDAFGHIAIGVNDVTKMCNRIKKAGGKIVREAGPVKGGTTIIAFAEDPDGYKIELIEDKKCD